MTRDWWQTDPTYVIDDPPKGFECPPIFDFCWTNDASPWTMCVASENMTGDKLKKILLNVECVFLCLAIYDFRAITNDVNQCLLPKIVHLLSTVKCDS